MIDTHHGIIAWFARNHVAANLLMLLIIGCGLISAYSIRIQVTPEVEIQQIDINIPFPGASPGEVESGVVLKVEEAVRNIEGIERMTSRSQQGSGTVMLDVETGYDMQIVMEEVNMAMGKISTLPEQAERYSINRDFRKMDAISVQITGSDLSEHSMKALATTIRDEILALPSVTKADITGARSYEISIQLDESKLRQYGLTLESVARAIRLSSLDLSAGAIKTDSGDIILRTESQAHTRPEFEDIVLLNRRDGTRLTLGDIAEVDDGFVEQEFFSLFNGEPSIGINVFAVSDQNQIEISEEVKEYVERRKTTLPEGIRLEAWRDTTELLNGTLGIMLSNMMFGILLVMLVLGLFLRIQLAFWVMLGIPIAFLGAFALMPLVGASVNMLSLFGFILVLGIVVDDAIVIGESVQTYTERDGQNIDNVIRGARQSGAPRNFRGAHNHRRVCPAVVGSWIFRRHPGFNRLGGNPLSGILHHRIQTDTAGASIVNETAILHLRKSDQAVSEFDGWSSAACPYALLQALSGYCTQAPLHHYLNLPVNADSVDRFHFWPLCPHRHISEYGYGFCRGESGTGRRRIIVASYQDRQGGFRQTAGT